MNGPKVAHGDSFSGVHQSGVARRRLPFVATGDFHLPEHVFMWKTLLACDRDEGAVVEKLCSGAPCALMRIS